MNDLYYIMLLVNMYNKEKKSILSMNATFSGCYNIVTSHMSKTTSYIEDPETGEIRPDITINVIS